MEPIISVLKNIRLGNYQKYFNFAVIPILSDGTPKNSLDYLVLQEAIANGLIIKEKPHAQVPVLMVENNTGKDVVILSGEYVVGGKQNRMVVDNYCLASDYKGEIAARCVQQNRWEENKKNEHFEYGGHVTQSIKTVSHDQGKVWDSVRQTLRTTGTVSGTSNFNDAYKFKKADIDDLISKFSTTQDQIGMLTAIGLPEKVLYALDVFDRPATFQKHHKNILSGRIIEALPFQKKVKDVDIQGMLTFLKNIENASATKEKSHSSGTTYRCNAQNAQGSALVTEEKVIYVNIMSTH